MDALYKRRTTADGIFGAKLHWDQFVSLRAETLGLSSSEPGYVLSADFLEQFLPGVKYVRIVRSDVDSQAVSLWFALHTGTWSLAVSDAADALHRAAVPYDYDGIESCRRLLENAEVHWDRFMRSNGIRPVEVVYEDLVAHHGPTLERVLAAIVPGGSELLAPPVPNTRRLADDRSREFLERLARDRDARGMPDPTEFVRANPPRSG
jgi:LPS sulfotransferase NodH